MKEYSKFVCISAGSVNYLIPSSQVTTSIYCNGKDYIKDGKFILKNNNLPFVNFYNDNNDIEYFGDELYTEMALIVKNTKLFENTSYFALITSKECSVVDLKYSNFTLFSNFFSSILNEVGFIACYFHDNNVYYLIDIEVFLRNFIL